VPDSKRPSVSKRLRAVGLRAAGRVAVRRALGRETLPWFREIAPLVSGRIALEIGGPSDLFAEARLLPVYPILTRCDTIDFSEATLWNPGRDAPGPAPPKGGPRRSVMEATDLVGIPDGAYGVVLSSHVLEHTANPLRAIKEWRRVLAPGGLLLLVVPDKTRSFDHARPVTTLEHLREDEKAGRGEDDLTHLDEVLRLHDLRRDPDAGTPEEFAERGRRNQALRALHHHVFDLRSVSAVVRSAGFELLKSAEADPIHLIVVARRPIPD